jgi:hypothetical protein
VSGSLITSAPGLTYTEEREGLVWIDPMGAISLTFFRLQLDAAQQYAPSQWGGQNPYWIGEWVRAGYAVMVGQKSAYEGPPYRIFLTADPWWVATMADANRDPYLFGLVDAPPPLAAEASRHLGYAHASGYGIEQREPSSPSLPAIPGFPGVLPLPGIPGLPSTTPATEPAPAPGPAPSTEPSPAEMPSWVLPAVGGAAGLGLLWWARQTGRL